MTETTKPSVTRTHFLIPFFSVRVNCEESTPCTLLLLSLNCNYCNTIVALKTAR